MFENIQFSQLKFQTCLRTRGFNIFSKLLNAGVEAVQMLHDIIED